MTTPAKLSSRQVQLHNLMSKGSTNKEMAQALDLSEHTIRVHLHRLFKKLGAKNRSHALHIMSMRDENNSVIEDAARYRYLRLLSSEFSIQGPCLRDGDVFYEILYGEELDQAIDEVMKESA